MIDRAKRRCSQCRSLGHDRRQCPDLTGRPVEKHQWSKIVEDLVSVLNEAMGAMGKSFDPCRPTLCVDLHGELFIEEAQGVTGEMALGACRFYLAKNEGGS
tara:strand:- start:7719 stop:8021 length:303 start_codon:yes stop_codon:yes gene_type:complete